MSGTLLRVFFAPKKSHLIKALIFISVHTVRSEMARDGGHTSRGCRQGSREHAIAHAARMLRECGATPAQTKVGIQLAFGKTKPVIADELGIQLSSVVDVAKKLYQNLDVHNSAELSTKIWLGQRQDEARQILRRAG